MTLGARELFQHSGIFLPGARKKRGENEKTME
jgi:hypothetical protein